jgi:hypothetical protein
MIHRLMQLMHDAESKGLVGVRFELTDADHVEAEREYYDAQADGNRKHRKAFISLSVSGLWGIKVIRNPTLARSRLVCEPKPEPQPEPAHYVELPPTA